MTEPFDPWCDPGPVPGLVASYTCWELCGPSCVPCDLPEEVFRQTEVSDRRRWGRWRTDEQEVGLDVSTYLPLPEA